MAEKLTIEEEVSAPAVAAEFSRPFIHRWSQLVSVTNWEKGRIISEWRAALVAEGAQISDYSDEAWAERVGNVTGQHVGRLRRTFERFGEVHAEYPGLFWSHFQVALDWDDAEMWLEGAVQNDWSVSQMRAKRWETLGGPESSRPRDEEIVTAELDEDSAVENAVTAVAGSVRDVADAELREEDDSADVPFDSDDEQSAGEISDGGQPATPKATRARPFENLPALPDDVAEAFEQFKLAILTHKMMGWTEISRDDIVACLGALEALALQPADD